MATKGRPRKSAATAAKAAARKAAPPARPRRSKTVKTAAKLPAKTVAKSKAARGATDGASFEQLIKTAANRRYVLRLYVTGNTARSAEAIANVRALCDEHLPGRYELEVVDIYQQPAEAQGAQIIAAPTLIKTLPSPPRRMIGNLSDKQRVLVGLDIHLENDEPATEPARRQARNVQWVEI